MFLSIRKCAVAVSAAVAVFAIATSSTYAAEEVNVTGTWTANYHCESGSCAGSDHGGVFVLEQPAGSTAVSGTINVTGGEEAPVTGSVSGHTLSLSGTGAKGYSATGVETISADGLSFSGTYEDSAGTKGKLTATRPSLPVTGSPGLRASAIEVICNYEVAPDHFTCTASVADASAATPAMIPTGTVSFTAPSGSFSPVAECGLKPMPGSPNTAACSVVYTSPTKIPTGTPAPVTGAYSGDATFAPSAAKSGAGAVVSPIVSAAKSTGEAATTTVSCPAGATSCPIVATLVIEESSGGAVSARSTKRKTITIGKTSLTLKGGQRKTVKVTLNRTGKKLLTKHKRFTALLKIASGGTVVKSQKVKLQHK